VDSLVRRIAIIGAIALTLTLAACARPVGDFGRAEADPLHDDLMPLAGEGRAWLAKEPVSAFNLTDQEQEMRDRIWRYLVAPHAFDWFQANIAELQRTRILPISSRGLLRIDRYYRWLHGERYASSRTRYSRVGEDTVVDIEMMPSVFASICAVIEIDRQRGIAANGIAKLEESVKGDAAARQAENNMQIGWFVAAVGNRYDSYNYALDHLLVETPHEEAVRVNGELNDLGVYVGAAQRGDFCSGNALTLRDAPAASVPSRYVRSQGPVKGS